MQQVRTNKDGSYNLSDLHQRLDDLEYARKITHGGGRSLTVDSLIYFKEFEHESQDRDAPKGGRV